LKFKFNTLLIILFLANNLFASDSLKFGNRFSIDFYLSIDQVNMFKKNVDRSASKHFEDFPNYSLENVIPIAGYYFSPVLSCRLYKNLRIKTGLKFDKIGHKTKSIITSQANYPSESHVYFLNTNLIGASLGISQRIRISKKIETIFACDYTLILANRTHTADGIYWDFGNEHTIDASVGLLFKLRNGDEISVCPDFDYIISPYYVRQNLDPGNPYSYYKYKKLNYYSIGLELGWHFRLKERKSKLKN